MNAGRDRASPPQIHQGNFGWSYDLVAFASDGTEAVLARLARAIAHEIGFRTNSASLDATSLREGIEGVAPLPSQGLLDCDIAMAADDACVIVSTRQSDLSRAFGMPSLGTDNESAWRAELDAWLVSAVLRASRRASLACAAMGPEVYGDLTRSQVLARDREVTQWATIILPDESDQERFTWIDAESIGVPLIVESSLSP